MIEIFNKLKSMGSLEYGSVIEAEALRQMAGIEIPEIGTREQFKEAALAELNVSDFIRGRLISEGKYFASFGSKYRVLLPSENANQVKKYMKSADSKLKRAIRLHDNTPKEYRQDLTKVRIHSRQEGIKEAEKKRKSLGL
jgi:hypothetical protein